MFPQALKCSHMKNEEVKIRLSAQEKEKWLNRAVLEGISLSELIRRSMESVPTIVPTNKVVPTEVKKDVPTSRDDKWAEGLVLKARERGEPIYWAEVRGELIKGGYSYDSTTTELKKDGILIKRFY